MKDKLKKVVGFLLLRPVFNVRNLTSLGLVGIFFGVYALSGGRFATLPKVESSSGFGAVRIDEGTSTEPLVVEKVVPHEAINEVAEESLVLDSSIELLSEGDTKNPQALEEERASPDLSEIEEKLQRMKR